MDASFWIERWETNRIGFHNNEANPTLVTYFDALSLEKGCRVFLPLCGKTLDIGWLLAKGYRVAGAELSELAVEQLFEELGVAPEITSLGELRRYSASNLDLFVGDIFNLTQQVLGKVDAIYDRAALVALPEAMRIRYTSHIATITNQARQLLLTFVYDQRVMEGPPFSVSDEEVHLHYADHYDLTLLASQNVPNGLKGFCPAKEHAWLLR